MIGMPDTREITDNCLPVFKNQFMQVQQGNVLLLYFPEFRMHGATVIAIACSSCGVVLILRIYQCSPRIHDPRYTFAAKIEIDRMNQSNSMAIFMCGSS